MHLVQRGERGEGAPLRPLRAHRRLQLGGGAVQEQGQALHVARIVLEHVAGHLHHVQRAPRACQRGGAEGRDDGVERGRG